MKNIKRIWPLVGLALVTFIFFWRFFIKGWLPIPADIITGVYYPWLDLKFSNYPVGVPVKNALPSDVVSLTYPLREFGISQIKMGILPFWNPYILSGTALLANFQSAVLYPLNLMYYLSDNFSLIWSWQVVLQPVLATIFCYMFLRSFGLRKLSAAFGSFVWGFGGFFSLWSQYNTVIHGILYLPLALYSIKMMSTKIVFGCLLSLSILFSVTAGNPPMTLILLLTSGLYALFEFKLSWQKYFIAILYILLGLGLSLPQLLPSLSLSSASIRDYDHIAFSSGIKYLPWYKLITMLIPDYFGNPSTGNVWNIAGLYDNLTVFVGITPFALAYSAIWSRSQKSKKLKHFGILLFLISMILMVKNPISAFLGASSFLGLSSMVFTRFSCLLVLSVGILSAIMIEELLDRDLSYKKPLLSAFLPLAIITVAIGLAWHKTSLEAHYAVAFRNSLLPLALSLSTFLSLSVYYIYIYQKRSSSKALLYLIVWSLCLLTVLDLYRFFNKYNTFSPSEYLYPENKIMSFAKLLPGRFARENDAVSPSNFWMHDRLMFSSGYDTLHSLKYNQFLQVLNGGDLLSVSSRYAEVNNPKSPLFDFLAIENVLTTKKLLGVPDTNGTIPYPFDQKKFVKIFDSGRMAILKNRNAFPMFYPVDSYVVATSSSDLQSKLLSLDLRHLAILTENPGLSLSSNLPEITHIDNQGQQISLTVMATGSGLIASSQVADSGWHLRVNSKERQLLNINHAFLGIPIEKGDREVVLYYFPSEFRVGVLVFFVSSFLLAGSALLYFKRNDSNS